MSVTYFVSCYRSLGFKREPMLIFLVSFTTTALMSAIIERAFAPSLFPMSIRVVIRKNQKLKLWFNQLEYAGSFYDPSIVPDYQCTATYIKMYH